MILILIVRIPIMNIRHDHQDHKIIMIIFVIFILGLMANGGGESVLCLGAGLGADSKVQEGVAGAALQTSTHRFTNTKIL